MRFSAFFFCQSSVLKSGCVTTSPCACQAVWEGLKADEGSRQRGSPEECLSVQAWDVVQCRNTEFFQGDSG